MEFLFLNHSASVEAIIVFLSVGVIFLILLYDVFLWAEKKYREGNPRKAYMNEVSDSKTYELPLVPDELLLDRKNDIVPPIAVEELEKIENNEGISLTKNGVNEEDDKKIEIIDGDVDLNPNKEDITQEIIDEAPKKTDEIEAIENIDIGLNISGDGTLDSEEKIEPSSLTEVSKKNMDSSIAGEVQVALSEDSPSEKETSKNSEEKKKPNISPSKKEKLVEIVNNVKTLIARGHIDDARSLIVNGLSIQKNHRELNLLMASLYERDHAFEKAEFVLKELAEKDPDDIEVLIHLATVIAMQRRFEVSHELYKKILSLGGETEEILYTLCHIASELGLSNEVYTYGKSYLKQYPKNPEILWLYGQSQIALGERRGAIETLIKLKNLTPYNQEIVDLISKLVTEDELAANFGEEKTL